MNNSQAEIRAALSQPETRLLLLASRPAWNEEHVSLASSLVPQVHQWDAFIDTAWRKYAVPFAYDNLSRLPDAVLRDDVLATLRAISLRATAEILRRQAAFDWFHERCVLASGVDHAYFKGAPFAASFYANPMQRYYRDVDILVPFHARDALIRCMLEQGCKVYPKTPEDERALARTSGAELRRALNICSMPGILTPQGLLVEIHDTPDQKTFLFSTEELLKNAETVATGRHVVRVMPKLPHIAFVLYHHTSHLWSKLNWLADIDAICRHPGFDRTALLAYGKCLKIETTIEAALELNDLTSAGHLPSDFEGSTPGLDLLRVCIEGLAGDVDMEKRMRKRQRMDALSFDWQPSPISLWRFVWLRLVNYKPLFADFMLLPSGPRLRYVGGILIGLLRSAHRRISEVLER